MTILSWVSLGLVLLIGGGFISFLLIELFQTRHRAPFIPSSRKSIRTILDRIPLPTQGLIMDLGAGDGRFLRQVKAKYPTASVKGFEISWVALVVAHLWNSWSRYPVPVIRQDFLQADVSQASVIFCFLLSKDLSALEHKLQTELKPGTRVISNTFSFPNWKPQIDLTPTETNLAGHIRVYVVS